MRLERQWLIGSERGDGLRRSRGHKPNAGLTRGERWLHGGCQPAQVGAIPRHVAGALGIAVGVADGRERASPLCWIAAAQAQSGDRAAALRSILLKLDRIKGVSEHVKRSLQVLKSFVGAVKVRVEGVEFAIDIDGEPGVADSGTLSRDLAEVFVAAGEAARARSASIVILIDEIQNLAPEEFEALIMAVHRTDQKRLPLLVVGAGLPHLVRLSGNAKTYAGRLFEYPDIGALDPVEARRALVKPAAQAKVELHDEAVAAVVRETQGHPYFLQEGGTRLGTQRRSRRSPGKTSRDRAKPRSGASIGTSSGRGMSGCRSRRKPIWTRWRVAVRAPIGRAISRGPWGSRRSNSVRPGRRWSSAVRFTARDTGMRRSPCPSSMPS